MVDTNSTMYQLSKDSNFHYEILRALASSSYDGADINECLVAANSIIPGDFESFASSFLKIANSVYKRALSIAKHKFPCRLLSTRLLADPRIMDFWTNQTQAFDQGLALLYPPGQRFNIKTSEFEIPCIWITPGEEVKPRPTIILGNGYDGSQEEMLHVAGLAALERGYNVLTYEGPGQPSVRRYQNKGFIPEWENVVTPIMDHVLSMTHAVDPKAVALYGLSFGGYLAPRVAAFDHRFAAIMAVDGVWDFGSIIRHIVGPEAMKIHDSGDKAKFDQTIKEFVQPGVPTGVRWGLEQGMWSFNTNSPFDYVTMVQNFTLAEVAHKIKTPVFVGDSENDIFFKGQPQLMADGIGKHAHLHLFKDKDAIGEHSGLGALKQQNQVIFDWFQDLLDDKAHGCGN